MVFPLFQGMFSLRLAQAFVVVRGITTVSLVLVLVPLFRWLAEVIVSGLWTVNRFISIIQLWVHLSWQLFNNFAVFMLLIQLFMNNFWIDKPWWKTLKVFRCATSLLVLNRLICVFLLVQVQICLLRALNLCQAFKLCQSLKVFVVQIGRAAVLLAKNYLTLLLFGNFLVNQIVLS